MSESETTVVEAQYTVRAIASPLVDYFWKFAEPFIKRALDNTSGEFTAQDLHILARERIIQLWLVAEGEKIVGACTTQIINYPRRRHCKVLTLAGSNSQAWAEDLDIILYNWAQQNGCSGIEANVKKSVVPTFAERGYKHKYSVVVKDISS